MSTTTIRLPEELRARVAEAARRAGKTPHKFILDAIAEKTDREERRADFNETAERRWEDIVATGETIAWPEMRRYLLERAAGKRPRRPAARKLSR